VRYLKNGAEFLADLKLGVGNITAMNGNNFFKGGGGRRPIFIFLTGT
jgi:hypothetical protein